MFRVCKISSQEPTKKFVVSCFPSVEVHLTWLMFKCGRKHEFHGLLARHYFFFESTIYANS